MFKNRKFTVLWIAEWIMPWLVMVPGIPAIYFCQQDYYELFEFFYSAATISALVIVILLIVISLGGFVWLWVNVFRKERFLLFGTSIVTLDMSYLIYPGNHFFMDGSSSFDLWNECLKNF